MANLNLSFREWPFISSNEIPQSQALVTPPLIAETIELLKSKILPNKSNMPSDHDSYSDSSEGDSGQFSASSQSANDNQNNNKVFNGNPPTKKKLYHLSSWGRCGLFACTFESCLSIFSNDDNGCLTPMFMFSPFEQFNVGKMNKQNFKNTKITAIGWANGYHQPSIAKPYFAVASEKGHVAVYDFSTKKIIGNLHLNEPVISILWSSYRLKRLYVGTSNGHFYICELNRKSIQIIKTFEFYSYPVNSSENVLKPVDFIIQDEIDGLTISIASKDGCVGYITDVNQPKQAKLQVFQQLPFNETNVKSNYTINFFEFYPNSQDFITIATNASTYLISISKGVLIPFIPTSNCKFISLLDSENDKVIAGYDNEIAIWKLSNPYWVRSSVTNFGGKFGLTEILTFSKLNNKFLLTTASNWLTEVETRRSKFFISKRIKLLNGVPVDYDFGNGSISFLMNNNMISITASTPESIIKPKFTSEILEESPDESSLTFHLNEDSNTDDYNDGQMYISKDDDDNSFFKSNSMIWDNNNTKIETVLRSTSEIINKNGIAEFREFIQKVSENDENETGVGNSNSIVFSFNIKDNTMVKKIEWISPQKLVAWSKNSFHLIDIQKREITEPIKKKYDKHCNTITSVFFSKSRRFICLIFNNRTIYVLDTESDFDRLISADFSTVTKIEYESLIGCFSPKEDQIVFAVSNQLFVSKLDKNLVFRHIESNLDYIPTFVSWKNRGLIIGTEKGSVFVVISQKVLESTEIHKRDISIIYDSARSTGKKKLGSIKLVSSLPNKSYIIIDTLEQGIVVSGNIQKTISDNIKTFKQFSKQSFLIRVQGFNKLIVMNAFGKFSAPPPPCFYSAQKNNLCFDPMQFYLIELSKDNKNNKLIGSIIQQLFRTNVDDPSVSLRNNAQLLNQIISAHSPFNSLSSKNFLKLGQLKSARNLLLNTEPCDKDYFNNLMLATAFNNNSNCSESVQLVVKNLLNNNLVDVAVDLLLITKNIYSAVEILFNLGRCKDAYQILMLNDFKSENEDAKDLVHKIANSLINKRENPIFGLKLLASFGYTQEMINQLSLNLE